MRGDPLVFVLRGRELISPPYRILETPHGFDVHYDGARSYGILAQRCHTLAEAKAVCESHRGDEA